MEATEGDELVRDADDVVGPNGNMNEMLNVGQEDQVSSAVLCKNSVIFRFLGKTYNVPP